VTARDADEDTVHNTDVGNARRLVRGFGDGIRYVPAWGRWLLYDGTRWARDDHEFIVQVAMDIAAEMREQARQTDDKALARWATQSESTARVDAMVRLARTEPRIPLDPDRLDADPWMLNVRNGTVDLHTGKLGEHRAGDLVTKLAPVTFDPSAQCPTWDRFIRQVLGDELGAYVQRAVGYSLTGTVSEQVLFFAYGTGANGKTTMLKTLQHVFGDYTTQATADVLTAADAHPGSPACKGHGWSPPPSSRTVAGWPRQP
jgi:putative DNA primase/helicase